jgi:hypothetical protein
MAPEITKEQLERQKELAAALEVTGKTTKELVAQYSEFKESLEEALGAQLKYATEEEKRLELSKQSLEDEQTRLKLLERFVALEKLKAAAALDSTRVMTDAQEQELKHLEQIQDQLKDEHASMAAALQAQKDLIKQAKDRQKGLERVVELQNNAEKIMENQLEQWGFANNKAGDMADNLLDIAFSGGTVNEKIKLLNSTFEGVGKSMRKHLSFKNLAKTAKNFLKDVGDSAKNNMFSADGLLMQYEQLGENFAQSTGLSQEYGKEIQSLTLSMNDQHFAMEETNRAYETLATQAKSFTDLNEAGRAALTEQALQFSRLGVSADTFAETIDNLGKTFGQTPDQINKTTEEMSNFARTLGVGPNKMLADFNKQLPLLARYGEKQGAQIFRELAYTAKKAGIEMEDLVGIAKTFDTFEGAAEAAGKLNFMLGGPLINSIDMINANESKRIQILKDSLRQSGKSFKQMGRFEKDLIAQTLNVDTAVAQKLFSNANLTSIKDATAAIQDQSKEMGSLASQAEDATTVAQRQKAADEAQLHTMNKLGEHMKKFHEFVTGIKRDLAAVAPVILGIQMAFKGLTIIMGLLKMEGLRSAIAVGIGWAAAAAGVALEWTLTGTVMAAQWVAVRLVALKSAAMTAIAWIASMTGIGTAGATAGAAVSLAWLPVTAAILAVLAAGALLYVFWDGLGAVGERTTDLFMGTLDGLKGVLKGFLKMVAYAVEGFVQFLFLPLSALVEGAAWVLDKIPGMGGIAGALKSFSPARIIHSYAGQIRGSIDAFEDGGTNIKGGAAIVGEKGPELLNLPRGSNVLTNENLNRLMLSLEKQATLGTEIRPTPTPGQTAPITPIAPAPPIAPIPTPPPAPRAATQALTAQPATAPQPPSPPPARTAPQTTGEVKQALNITLELDGDVLAKTTRKIAFDTMTQAMSLVPGQ